MYYPQEEGWVVCRVFKKRTTMMRNTTEHESPCWYDDQVSLMPDMDSPKRTSQSINMLQYAPYTFKKELHHHLPLQIPHDHLIHFPIPILDNSKLELLSSPQGTSNNNNALIPLYDTPDNINHGNGTLQQLIHDNHNNGPTVLDDRGLASDQVTDWRVLDKFVASQLSQEDVPKGNNNNYSSSTNVIVSEIFPTPILSDHSNKEESMPDNASTSTSSSQIDGWK